jgi:cytidylate kinase
VVHIATHDGGARAAASSNVIAMVVAIDGPAGAGKSTVARAVAERLGFTYLDSGAMYRAVALAADGREDEELAAIAEAADIRLGDRIMLDGRDVTEAIRTPAVTERSSRVSADPAVRAALVRKQRELMSEGDWVAEGRDIGTVVCPDAEVKVFLTARPEVRARRRADQFGEDYETVLADQAIRDRRDMEREHSPLAPAPDAVPVDTSDLDLDGVLGQIETLVVEVREIAP